MTTAGTLEVTTPTDREIVMTRVFDAPRKLVWDAWTRPELVQRWLLGSPGWSMPACEIDLRVGGRFHYLWRRDSDGREMGLGGVYREVVPPERFVHTELFDGDVSGNEAVVTSVLTEHEGRTTLTTTMLFPTREIRDAAIASGMARGVAVSYDRLADLMQEIGRAREVQARLMPRSRPPLSTLEYRGRCLQAQGIGGDYYDFLALDPGAVGFVLSDIAGKGIPAALLMANLQASLRSQCSLARDDLPRLLRSVNRLFWESTEAQRFATVFFGVYDDVTRRLRFANCGHNPPLVVGEDGRVERLADTATVLGMLEEWDCSVNETELQPGDVLVIYSDGVSEAMNDAGELYGEARLLDVIRANREQPVDELLEAIVADVVRFGGPVQQDDLTLIVGRCRESPAA